MTFCSHLFIGGLSDSPGGNAPPVSQHGKCQPVSSLSTAQLIEVAVPCSGVPLKKGAGSEKTEDIIGHENGLKKLGA